MRELYEGESFIYDKVPVQVYIHNLRGMDIYTYLHWHTNIEFNLAIAGRMRTIINGKEQIMEAGEWNVINSGELHENHWVKNDDFFNGITVQFGRYLFERWIGKNVHFSVPQDKKAREEIADSILKFAAIDSSDNNQELEEMEETFHFMILLKKYCIKTDINTSVTSDNAIEKVKPIIQYIDKNYMECISLTSVASQFHYTPEHLSRMFKINIGYNFNQYLQNVRLMHCVDIIKEKRDIKLSDVAFNNGFPNIKSFIETFKRNMGCTPSQWLRQQKI